jgi:hypothetical protein
VTVIRTLEEAFASLRRMFAEALGWPVPGWLEDAERAWDAPEPELTVPTAIPVWRDPWMVVGSDTFAGDIAARLGLLNVYGVHRERYPRVELDDITKRAPSSSSSQFTVEDGPGAFPRPPGRAGRGTQPDLVRPVPGHRPIRPGRRSVRLAAQRTVLAGFGVHSFRTYRAISISRPSVMGRHGCLPSGARCRAGNPRLRRSLKFDSGDAGDAGR